VNLSIFVVSYVVIHFSYLFIIFYCLLYAQYKCLPLACTSWWYRDGTFFVFSFVRPSFFLCALSFRSVNLWWLKRPVPEIRRDRVCRQLYVCGVLIIGVFSQRLETLSLADYCDSACVGLMVFLTLAAVRFGVSITVLTASFLEWRVISKLRYRGICFCLTIALSM